MKRRLIGITILFSMIAVLAAVLIQADMGRTDAAEKSAGQAVLLNEVVQLAKAGEWESVSKKAGQLQDSLRQQTKGTMESRIYWLSGISVLFFVIVFGYVYAAILRPFGKMKEFAGKVAQGNLDVPLDYERSNYFGEFTWAFDSMRREITKARACEHEAIENNKTVIATLSHDIKTPIASIRAYAEGLEANLDDTALKREKYIRVLLRKCDEVTRLTNDLFLHSLADLDKLKISVKKMELCGFLERAAAELGAQKHDVHFHAPAFPAFVSADEKRLLQITENLINNARKYARSDIDLFLTKEDGSIQIHFRDYGKGILDEDMPFIFGKFYRGKNCGDEQGSGLGLYIVKYIADQMGGSVLLRNHMDGLEAVVSLCELDE